MTCKNYQSCRHYCALTESCDYMLDTGFRRPQPAASCPGYPLPCRRRFNLILPGSWHFVPQEGGRINA